jgi:hypothetical protein
MRADCKWLNDAECPYAMGYEECDDCDKYEPVVHPSTCGCDECRENRGCAEYHLRKEADYGQTE